jgi:hypothetical protein
MYLLQGGYVLYRLFRKQEEKPERASPEEVDRSGYSPTPSRSSPDNIEANEEANTPLNKESPESGLHESPIELPNSIETHATPMTRWLTGRDDNLVPTAADVSRMPFNGHANVPEVSTLSKKPINLAFNISLNNIHHVTILGFEFLLDLYHLYFCKQVNSSAAASAQFVNPLNGNGNLNNFVPDIAPSLPHGNAFIPDFQQIPFGFDGNMNPPDALDVFLNQALVDPDEHSSTTSRVQYDSDIPTEFENNGVAQVMVSTLTEFGT